MTDIRGDHRRKTGIVGAGRGKLPRAIVEHADTVSQTDEVRRRAARLVSVLSLRAADALQLAAALIWCEEQPHGEAFACLDLRLRDAAHREGFDIRP